MKSIFKLISYVIFIIFFSLTYLSLVGIETKKFNNQIVNKVKNINENLKIDLKEIIIVLDPFNFKLDVKTNGPRLTHQNKIIELENIKTKIPLKSLVYNEFLIENLEISTKTLMIKDLIAFVREFNKTPELYILEKIIKKGYLIADIKVEFDKNGSIKDNYEISGFIKNSKISILKKYNVNKLNLNFNIEKNKFEIKETNFLFNDLNFLSKKTSFIKVKDEYLIKGNIENKNSNLNKEKIQYFIKHFTHNLDIKKIIFSSENIFSFKLYDKFKFKDFEITSNIKIDKLLILNNFGLKNFFPNIKKDISLSNNSIKIQYKKENFKILGSGDILFQEHTDYISYLLVKKKNQFKFDTSLKIKNNPLTIDFLNFEKNQNIETLINLKGKQDLNKKTVINLFSLTEKNDLIEVNDLVLNNKFKIISIEDLSLNYFDKYKKQNLLNLSKKNQDYILKGSLFNADYVIDNLLESNNKNISKFFDIDCKFEINIDKVYLDKINFINNFTGILSLKNQKIVKAKMIGNFSNEKKLSFTINTNGNNKITTLFLDYAHPIVSRYKFIKGFNGGKLDYYSSSNDIDTNSTLKIYDFKLKELPLLTKILTLGSLQGIADILSGEGIRFNEFEMNFNNNKDQMTINEIYAIGPAISILMDGYVQKNKLISLRGTLVPATTINKFIGSLPVLGKILVGSKTGEGVFGVSFKIKGPPDKLETSVNPIKTLTPRFITRTLEKIKKN
jgi:hypothetical protein